MRCSALNVGGSIPWFEDLYHIKGGSWLSLSIGHSPLPVCRCTVTSSLVLLCRAVLNMADFLTWSQNKPFLTWFWTGVLATAMRKVTNTCRRGLVRSSLLALFSEASCLPESFTKC